MTSQVPSVRVFGFQGVQEASVNCKANSSNWLVCLFSHFVPIICNHYEEVIFPSGLDRCVSVKYG